ncbi:MAG: DNA mismatch repair protein MutS [Flavobacteriaceae bacterium]|nr:DNA mismatch repair protein MutS [Flavobacteriaceae bacterium]
MNSPNTFYKTQLIKHKAAVKRAKKRLVQLGVIRFLVFASTIFAIYLSFGQVQRTLIISVIGIAIFLFLLKKYGKIKYEKKLSEALVHINKEEIEIASGDFLDRGKGLEFQDPKHFYSLDIDLFGKGSFFQYINRTIIKEGTQALANALSENSTKKIVKRQHVIKELSSIPEWRQLFSGIGSLIKTETPTSIILNWIEGYNAFTPKIMRWLPVVFSTISALLLGLSFLNITSSFPAIIWLLLGLIISGIYLKNISKLSSNSDKLKDTFKQYSLLLNQIENTKFTSEILREKHQKLMSDKKKSSAVFGEFSKYLDALDNRNNLLFAFLGNGFLLWDVKQSYKIEQWILKYNTKVRDWFEVISFFDAYNSLGNFSFNHPEYIFPKIVESSSVLKAKGLGHPLVNKTKRIDNDLTINHQEFFIVTGANMAGKSTFLRTVSIHIVMANIGLPVCAKESHYSPVKLITSMRTTDSLTEDSSYFFSELTRLKFIVDAIKKEPYFIILDEILKGTNSTDKAIGSRKFIEKLVSSKATGIIATHDLSLCEIDLKEVKNYYFDAEIINDELYFDYIFKNGICKNMNASFLLKKMEII